MYLPVLEKRIKVAMIAGAFTAFRSTFYATPHCMCQCLPGIMQYGEMSDIVALCAPRPVLLINGTCSSVLGNGLMLLLDRIQFGYANSGRQWFLNRLSACFTAVLLGVVVCGGNSAKGGEPKPEDLKFFETKIRPLLHKQCGSCHGEEAQESGLRLDTYRGIWEGGDLGPTVVPGDVKHSLLFAAVER